MHTADRVRRPAIAAAVLRRARDERRHACSSAAARGTSCRRAPAARGRTAAICRPSSRRAGYSACRPAPSSKALAALGRAAGKAARPLPPDPPARCVRQGGRRPLQRGARAAEARGVRDQPMLDDMTRLALRGLAAHSPHGFYLMVEGASIDKQRARRRMPSADLGHDRVRQRGGGRPRVRAEHERRRRSRERHARDRHRRPRVRRPRPHRRRQRALRARGRSAAVRDYAAVFRFTPEQVLDFFPNYEPDAAGFPDRSRSARKLLLGWAAAPGSVRELALQSLAAPRGLRGRGARLGGRQGLQAHGGDRQPRAGRRGGGQRQSERGRQAHPRLPRPGRDRERRALVHAGGGLPGRYLVRAAHDLRPYRVPTSRSPRRVRARCSSPAPTTTPTSCGRSCAR